MQEGCRERAQGPGPERREDFLKQRNHVWTFIQEDAAQAFCLPDRQGFAETTCCPCRVGTRTVCQRLEAQGRDLTAHTSIPGGLRGTALEDFQRLPGFALRDSQARQGECLPLFLDIRD